LADQRIAVSSAKPQDAPRLRNNELVANRIEELQARNERKAEMAALTRDDSLGFLRKLSMHLRSFVRGPPW
jgi:hypothetical protein